MRGAGCGVRGGVGADAPTNFIWGMWTGGEETDFGLRIWDFGFREGVPLMRQELYMGHVHRRG